MINIKNKMKLKISQFLLHITILLGLANADDRSNEECKFKSQYFAEFDLTPLTKTDGNLYTTEEMTFVKLFEFNFCEYIP